MITRDLNHIWHPCTQMKDFETSPLLEVISAEGSRIRLNDGSELIDGISSWWCKSLGHQHPRLRDALMKQAHKFEHVIFANTTNEVIVQLSEMLASLSPALNKVMYASDGSSVVEMALKLSLHTRYLTNSKRHRFITLENSYHGETIGALSVSDLGLYRAPYAALTFDVDIIRGVPYVDGEHDPLWHDVSDVWEQIEKQLAQYEDSATAVIVEPIVQGAGGMKIYSRDFLRRLREWTAARGIHLIADEIMTGMGRTGEMLACTHASIEPDFLCLGKGLTSGWLPFSALLTRAAIYDLFYDDYASGKSFLHSHTHSGNVLAASVACEVFAVMRDEATCAYARQIGKIMRENMQSIANATGQLQNVRQLGAIVAADLIVSSKVARRGYYVCQNAIRLGALLRPLGNTIYWVPPLNINFSDLHLLKEITEKAISG